MAIDIATEQAVSLTEAARQKWAPVRRGGKKPAVSTFYRWAQHGIHGIKLETIKVGGTTCTSVEAMQRFFDALTAAAEHEPLREPVAPARKSAIERAEREMAQPIGP